MLDINTDHFIMFINFQILKDMYFFSFFLWIIFSRIQSYKAVAWQRNLAKATAILEIYNILI